MSQGDAAIQGAASLHLWIAFPPGLTPGIAVTTRFYRKRCTRELGPFHLAKAFITRCDISLLQDGVRIGA